MHSRNSLQAWCGSRVFIKLVTSSGIPARDCYRGVDRNDFDGIRAGFQKSHGGIAVSPPGSLARVDEEPSTLIPRDRRAMCVAIDCQIEVCSIARELPFHVCNDDPCTIGEDIRCWSLLDLADDSESTENTCPVPFVISKAAVQRALQLP